MNVKLYRYKGDIRVANKSSGLTLLLEFPATYLKEPESIRNINLRLQYSDESTKNAIMSANYCYITELGRYYYIKPESVLSSGQIIILSLEEDDIMTNLSEVKSLRAIISKQETKYNLYVNDNNFKAYQNPLVFCRTFPNGFNSDDFIMIVAGS